MRRIKTTRFVSASAGQSASLLAAILVLVSGIIPSVFGQSPTCVVTDLTGENATQVPLKLNNLGDIVGRKGSSSEGAPRAELLLSMMHALWLEARQTSSGDHAFVWRKQTGMVDLNDAGSAAGLGVVLVEAHATNNKGEILAMGIPVHMVHGTAPAQSKICAPPPPSSFLLTPHDSP